MKKIVIFCFTFMLLCGCNSKTNINNQKEECKKISNLLENGAILIDVRTEEEYASSHLDNSVNISVDEILDGIIALDLKKDCLL